ncbi:MAG: PGPGW domain-containing protein [Mycobacteriaceae bacterium]
MSALRRTGTVAAGWFLVVVGVAALILPGPGLLMLFAGLAVLSQEYEWAARRVEPVKIRAFVTTAEGVKTLPRVAASTLGGAGLVAAGVLWSLDGPVPEYWIFGPDLPFGGLMTGLTLVLSGFIVWALIIYSYLNFRGRSADEVRRLAGEGSSADRD